MAGASPRSSRSPASLLARARDLASQVRQAAEWVRQQAREARRLTAIARGEAERGRALSRRTRRQAREAPGSAGKKSTARATRTDAAVPDAHIGMERRARPCYRLAAIGSGGRQ
jgi:hypothetical protein